MIYACRWLLPIETPPVERGWIEIDAGRIRRLGHGVPPARAHDLGDVALLPGLVNAHTHLELSWMAGLVPPADSMNDWVRTLMRVRRAGFPGRDAEHQAARDAAAVMFATGTSLVGDISNTLMSPAVVSAAGLGGTVFHELLGFSVNEPATPVDEALRRVAAATPRAVTPPVHVTIAAHAPYSVSPALFREIAMRAAAGPLAVHVGESREEIDFLHTGGGPIRTMLENLGVWNPGWQVPRSGPIDYLASVGYLRPGMLAVHGVHLLDDELERLRQARATLVTCPRSNLWVGAGMPRVSHFYAARLPVAIGTDSLASVATLNLFDELAELRRIAPDVAAGALLDSATRVGAEALGFGGSHGTLAPGKAAAIVAVQIPPTLEDVEEYLVSGVAASAVRRIH